MNTPKTNEALAAIFKRDGSLSEENAPKSLVKLCLDLENRCRKLENEAAQLREQVVNSRK